MTRLNRTTLLAATLCVTLAACEEKKTNNNLEFITPNDENAMVDNSITMYGICGRASTANTLELLTDSGDTLNINITPTRENGGVLGDLQPGDRIAVVSEKGAASPRTIINETMLMGDWLMPNPLDGSSEVGIRFRDGGIAESIEQSSIIYRSWKLVGGKLEIMLVREGGGDEEEINQYEITKLDDDSLIISNADDTFEYGRAR